MQAVASYISRRFFVGNCRKFVVSLSDCQRKTFIFKALRRFLSTYRPYYRWRSCLHNWPVCKTVLIWALSGLCPDSALWLWAIIERIRIACQKAYLLADSIYSRSYLGKTPMAYINTYRLQQAALLLETTDIPITTLCLECGFNNLGHFFDKFKSLYGITPLQFRKGCTTKSQNRI